MVQAIAENFYYLANFSTSTNFYLMRVDALQTKQLFKGRKNYWVS